MRRRIKQLLLDGSCEVDKDDDKYEKKKREDLGEDVGVLSSWSVREFPLRRFSETEGMAATACSLVEERRFHRVWIPEMNRGGTLNPLCTEKDPPSWNRSSQHDVQKSKKEFELIQESP